MLKLLETTGGYGGSPGIKESLKQQQEESRRRRHAEDTLRADNAFRLRKHEEYIESKTAYDDLLTETQRKKVALARKKTPQQS